jgi:hypothetical protein
MADIKFRVRLRVSGELENDLTVTESTYTGTESVEIYNPSNINIAPSGTTVSTLSSPFALSVDTDGNLLEGEWRIVVDTDEYSFEYTSLDFTVEVSQTPDGYTSQFESNDVTDYTGWSRTSRTHTITTPSAMDNETSGGAQIIILPNIYSGQYVSTVVSGVERSITPIGDCEVLVTDDDTGTATVNVYKIDENTVFDEVEAYFSEYRENLSVAPKRALDQQPVVVQVGNTLHQYEKALRGGDNEEMYRQLVLAQAYMNPDYLDEEPDEEEIVPYEQVVVDHSHDNKTTVLDKLTVVAGNLYFDGVALEAGDGKIKASETDPLLGYLDGKVDNTSIEVSGEKARVKPSYAASLQNTSIKLGNYLLELVSSDVASDIITLGGDDTEWYNYNNILFTRDDATTSAEGVKGKPTDDIDDVTLANQDITITYGGGGDFELEEPSGALAADEVGFNNKGAEVVLSTAGDWVRYRYNVTTESFDLVASSLEGIGGDVETKFYEASKPPKSPPTSDIRRDSRVGILKDPDYELDVLGNVGVGDAKRVFLGNAVHGTELGLSDADGNIIAGRYLEYYQYGSANGATNTGMFVKDGKVGVKTNDPADDLHVVGNVRASSLSTAVSGLVTANTDGRLGKIGFEDGTKYLKSDGTWGTVISGTMTYLAEVDGIQVDATLEPSLTAGKRYILLDTTSIHASFKGSYADVAAWIAAEGVADNDVVESDGTNFEVVFDASAALQNAITTSGGNNWVFDVTSSEWVNQGGSVEHNSLSGLNLGDYKHLTAAEKANFDILVGAGNTTLHSHTFANITSKPNSIGGYQIIDAYTITNLNTSGQAAVHWGNLTNIDTYTKSEAVALFGRLASANTWTANQTILGTLILGTQTNKATISYTTNTARTLTIPNVAGNRTFSFIDQAETISGIKTFYSGQKINNPANTFAYTITAGAIAADRVLNLPVITGTDTLATLGLAQTFSAVKTFSANPVLSADSATLSFSSTTGVKTISTGGTTDLNLAPGRRLGIGSAAPPQKITITDAAGVDLLLQCLSTENDGTTYGALNFWGSTADLGSSPSAQIKMTRTATGAAGDMRFSTRTTAGNTVERMRIHSAGGVSIAQTTLTSGYILDVNGNTRVAGNVVATGEITAYG